MERLKILVFVLFVGMTTSLSLHASTATLLVGQSYQTEISVTGYHYLGIESVSSTNPSVSVTKTGLIVKATVNAYFPGEAVITVRLRYQMYAGQSYQYRNKEFSISCNDTYINVSPSTVSIKPDESYQLSYGFNRPTYVTPSLQWASSDEAIAIVSSTGLILAKSEGDAIIYLRSNLGSNTSECRVKVSGQSGTGGEHESPIADTSWFNDDESEFEISTLSQLLGFRNLVNQGNTFQGKTVKLIKDIDLSTISKFIPIGNVSSNRFKGTFEGNNHNLKLGIYNIDNASQNSVVYGLFGYSGGIIRNLIVTGAIKIEIANFTTYCYVGAICAYNSGTIESCVNKATIEYSRTSVKSTGNEDFIGGVVGNSDYSITNCINEGEIRSQVKYSSANTNGYYIGGIGGKASAGIKNCANKALIKSSSISDESGNSLFICTGGIIGLSSSSTIQKCSNFGDIISTARNSGTGGIIGNANPNTTCKENYVGKCKISNTRGGSIAYVNAIVGRIVWSNFSQTNNYSANDISYANKYSGEGGNTMYSSSQMKTIEFADVLGSNSWIGAEGLYPIVKGSPDESLYYVSSISDITCTSAVVFSNIGDVLTNRVKSWGILMTKDDGKESYVKGDGSNYTVKLNGLEPSRTYKLRWFAQDDEGKEYYGVFTSFTTKPISPYTSDAYNVGVSTAVLTGESYLDGDLKCGFFLQKDDNTDNGKYYWVDQINEDSKYNLYINNLAGNSKYKYSAVVEYDGILHAGEVKTFDTKSLMTLSPSCFTESTAQLNGEISKGLSNVYFEFRSLSLPSVIDSDIINATLDNNRATALSPMLNLNESYKYRLVADNGSRTLHSDWIEFLFTRESGIEEVIDEHAKKGIDYSAPYEIYNLSGTFIGTDKETIASGLYIIRQHSRHAKVIVR